MTTFIPWRKKTSGLLPVRWGCLSCFEHEAASPCFAPSPCCLCNHPAAGLSVPFVPFSPGWSLLRSSEVDMVAELEAVVEVEAVSAQKGMRPFEEATTCRGQGGLQAFSEFSYSSVSDWGVVVEEEGRCWPHWTAVGPSASPCYEQPSPEAAVGPADPLWLAQLCETEDDVHSQLTPGSWIYLRRTRRRAFNAQCLDSTCMTDKKIQACCSLYSLCWMRSCNSLISPPEGIIVRRMNWIWSYCRGV